MGFTILNRLVAGVVVLGGVALIVLVVTTGWQVWGRYVLNDTPTWAERLALLLILIVALPVAAVGLRENIHLGVRFLVERLPHRLARIIEFLNTIVLGLFGLAMAHYSWRLVDLTWDRQIPLLGVPQAYQYLPLVVSGLLIVVFMLERLWFFFRSPAALPTGVVSASMDDDQAGGGRS